MCFGIVLTDFNLYSSTKKIYTYIYIYIHIYIYVENGFETGVLVFLWANFVRAAGEAEAPLAKATV